MDVVDEHKQLNFIAMAYSILYLDLNRERVEVLDTFIHPVE